MTNPDYTALAMLVDRSGSMIAVADDARGGMAQLIKDQRELPGKCTLRVSQFDDSYETVHESLPIADVPEPQLVPRGSTALLDGWGKLMTEFGEELAALPDDERPGHVIFVVVTDGQENASLEWTRQKVFDKVTEQREKYGWEFLFLAADQDAVSVGASYGVSKGGTMSYDNTAKGNAAAYGSVSAAVTATRTTGQAPVLTPEE